MASPAPAFASSAPDVGAENFARAYGSHSGIFRRLAFRYLRMEDDAAEAVQEGFLRAWRFRSRFRGDCALTTWIGIIIRRECARRLRTCRSVRSSREVPLEEWHDQGANDEAPLHHLERDFVLGKLPQLRPRQRLLVSEILDGKPLDMRLPANKAARHQAITALRRITAGLHPYAD